MKNAALLEAILRCAPQMDTTLAASEARRICRAHDIDPDADVCEARELKIGDEPSFGAPIGGHSVTPAGSEKR